MPEVSLALRDPRRQGREGWPELLREGERIKGKGDEREEERGRTQGLRKKSGQRTGDRKKGRGEARWGEIGREIRDKTAGKGQREQSRWQEEKLEFVQPLHKTSAQNGLQGLLCLAQFVSTF